jgi:hypothetical protein
MAALSIDTRRVSLSFRSIIRTIHACGKAFMGGEKARASFPPVAERWNPSYPPSMARFVIITVAVSSLMAHTSPGVGNRLRVRFVFVTVRP